MKRLNSGAKQLAHPKYRPDIDGLRAVAVAAVVCFHAFPGILPGGFIGVDIFFVISGFLISSILLRGLQAGTFTFREFYLRRILRIFPALVVVLAFCYLVGWLVLLPAEFKQLGKHMVGGAGFISNLLFWQESGYFDNASATKPLLHLWSLGVEEQYYIVWPCLLLFAWRQRLDALRMAAAVIVASFAVNLYTVQVDPVQSFYSPLARFWELLLGALLAYLNLHMLHVGHRLRRGVNALLARGTAWRWPAVNPVQVQNGLSLLGAGLILGAALWVDEGKIFPGGWALLPTGGAYLLIAAGPKAVVNRRILAARPLVWIGLISYPFYLWHWPLLSFARIMENKTPTPGLRGGAVLLALLFAWLTYRFVERPIRFRKRSPGKIGGLLLALLLLAALGGNAYFKGNVRSATLRPEMIEQIAQLDFALHFAQWSPCPNDDSTWSCKILDPTRPARIALIGDSHSVHLAPGLATLASVARANIVSHNSNGFMPVFEVEVAGKRYYHSSDDFIDKALEEAIRSESIETIMLAGYAVWKLRPQNAELQLEEVPAAQVAEKAAILERALTVTLARLVASGKKIVFFVDVPVLDFEPSECVAIRPLYLPGHARKDPCVLPRARFAARNVEYHRIVQTARQAFPTVKFVNTYDYLCDEENCHAWQEGVLLYRDNSHLSAEGSRWLFGKMAGELAW